MLRRHADHQGSRTREAEMMCGGRAERSSVVRALAEALPHNRTIVYFALPSTSFNTPNRDGSWNAVPSVSLQVATLVRTPLPAPSLLTWTSNPMSVPGTG